MAIERSILREAFVSTPHPTTGVEKGGRKDVRTEDGEEECDEVLVLDVLWPCHG